MDPHSGGSLSGNNSSLNSYIKNVISLGVNEGGCGALNHICYTVGLPFPPLKHFNSKPFRSNSGRAH